MISSMDVKLFMNSKLTGVWRVRSINGTRQGQKVTHYIEAWSKEAQTTEPLREKCLSIIYGPQFADMSGKHTAGNVRENCITMNPSQWETLIINNG